MISKAERSRLFIFKYFVAIAFLFLSLPVFSAAPANDSIGNAALIAGFIGSITNLSVKEATASSTDPEYNASLASIWFKFTPSTSCTGVVSALTATGSIRIFEFRAGSYVRVASGTTSAALSAEGGKTYYLGLLAPLGTSSTFTFNYNFYTLQRSSPDSLVGFVADVPINIEFINLESTMEFQSAQLSARIAELGTNALATGTQFPISTTWTSDFAGPVDIFAVGVTKDGEVR
jgi:hypothetical protein